MPTRADERREAPMGEMGGERRVLPPATQAKDVEAAAAGGEQDEDSDYSENDSLLIGSEVTMSSMHPHGARVPRNEAANVGGHVLSVFGTGVVLFNSLIGPGIALLPQVFQQAGWVVPVISLSIVCVLASFSATFFSDAIARIPGNSHLDVPVTFVGVCDTFLGRTSIWIVRLFTVLGLFASIVTCLAQAAQVFDSMVVLFTPSRTTYALEISTSHIRVINWTAMIEYDEDPNCGKANSAPFQGDWDVCDGCGVLTVGYALLSLLVVMLFLARRPRGKTVTRLRFFATVYVAIEFVQHFLRKGLEMKRVPAFGTSYRWMLGILLFNYSFIPAVPVWLGRQGQGVSINRAVWSTSISATVCFMILGVLGGMSMDKHSDISFVSFLANNCNHATTRVCAFIFAVVVFAMSVPDIAALLYGTLTAEEMFSPRAAKFLSFVMPFLVSWGCYHTHALSAVISRGGMALAAPTNLLIPMLVSLKALDVVFFKNPLSSSEGGRQQGAFRVAGKSDIFDSANRRTVVRPLPYGVHRYQRLIGSMLFCVTIGGLITCVVLSLRCVMARGLVLVDWEC